MTVGANVAAKLRASVRQNLDLKIESGLVAEASLSCLAAIRAQLLVARDIVLEDDPLLEDEAIDDADDCELDLGDEDVPEEAETEGISDQEAGPGWTHDEGFSLRVVADPKDNEKWQVNVPLCGWEGLVGKTRRGRVCVDAVSARQLVYLRLAVWLEAEHHDDVLAKGPFARGKPFMKQKDLLGMKLDGEALFKGVETIDGKSRSTAAANLSRYLKNVDLSWPQGSIPLRKLFAD